uniref:Uncharacterized protein n=1 Tax=Mycena chlorophos TaxID=658473 RepID=A0ABQ0M4A9_MYCCL|nr:predicted protein [Mycena chlorophos]
MINLPGSCMKMTSEKKKKDDEEERREMARVEQAAQIAYSQDLGAGRAKGSGSSSAPAPVASSSKKPAPKSSNPWANYSTAKSLGYEDPDVARDIALAQGQRLDGTVGEWQVVVPEIQPSSTSATEAGVKRPAEPLDEEENREFKLRKKTMVTGLGQIYDPGALSLKLKKKEEDVDVDAVPEPAPTVDGPKWSKTQWTDAGHADDIDTVKREPTEEQKPTPEVKSEPDLEPPPPLVETVVFKKRSRPKK